MPIYAYRCSACGHAKDVLQKMSDPVLSTCPACGAEAFTKQVTAAGFQLKGSGWYATDFKGGGAAAAAGGAGGAAAASDSAPRSSPRSASLASNQSASKKSDIDPPTFKPAPNLQVRSDHGRHPPPIRPLARLFNRVSFGNVVPVTAILPRMRGRC